MNYAGISHFADTRDCFFTSEDTLRVRIQTSKNDIDAIYLHTRDKYIGLDILDTRDCVEMTKYASDFCHDYFRADLHIKYTDHDENLSAHPDTLCLRYFFELIDNAGARIWYGDSRFFGGEPGDIEAMFDCPLMSRKEQLFEIPDWAKNAVVYQIFPTRFATTEEVPAEKWYKAPISFDDDLRGNLAGITAHLDYIKSLGADVIYMTPIFKSNTSHKYDTVDYYEIDPSLGTSDDLHELIDKAHALGLRVMIDGVFNHTSPDFFAFKDILENGRDSKYINWYNIDRFPIDMGHHDKKPSFQSFAYFGGMPKLNLANPETADYIINVAKYYIKEFRIDGIRLDVGDEIGHDFWKRFRKEIKSENTDALIVGEIWHFAPDFLQGDEWDSVMNYAFYKAVSSLLCEHSIKPSEFVSERAFLQGNYNSAVIPVLWNLFDSHDTSRFLYRVNGDKRRLRLAAALQMLLPGTPFIYYGDEVGLTGGEDPDNRRGMLWDESKQDKELYAWYQKLTYFRHMVNDIPAGNYRSILPDDRRDLLELHLMSGEILIFHTNENEAPVKEYAGYRELLSDSEFGGMIGPYETVLLRK